MTSMTASAPMTCHTWLAVNPAAAPSFTQRSATTAKASTTRTLAIQGSTSPRRYPVKVPSAPGCGGCPGEAVGVLRRLYLVSVCRADWDTATTAPTKATMAAGVQPTPLPKPRSSRTVWSAPECELDSHAITAGTANIAVAITSVMNEPHPRASTATSLWRSWPRRPGMRVIHHHRKIRNVTPAAITGQIHHEVAVREAVHCCVGA